MDTAGVVAAPSTISLRSCGVKISLLLLFVLHLNSALGHECEGSSHISPDPALGLGTQGVYFYNGAQGLASDKGSLIFFNEEALVVDCSHAADFVQYVNNETSPLFSHAFVANGGIVVASMKTTDNGVLPYNNNWKWVFFDHYFRPKETFPSLEYAGFDDSAKSAVFNTDAFMWPQDLVILDGTRYALLLISQRKRVKTREKVVNAAVDQVELVDIGLRVVDRRTRRVMAEVSGFEFFTTSGKDWPEYLAHDMRERLKTPNTSVLPIGYISSVVEVPGEHWSNSLLGKRTFLICHQLLQTIDLITWDFEEQKRPEFIWRLPGPNAPKALRDEWGALWVMEFDPLDGFAGPLDITVKNAIPRHIIVHEDGRSHSFDRGDGEGCPMSRVVEYHIDVDIDGQGTNRAELVFSHPSVDSYPPILDLAPKEKKYGDELRDLCREFWSHFPYQVLSGSVSRTKQGNTIIAQHGDGEVFINEGTPPYSQVLVEVDRYDNLVARWNATGLDVGARGGASRIQFLEAEEFRDGEFTVTELSIPNSATDAKKLTLLIAFVLASRGLWLILI